MVTYNNLEDWFESPDHIIHEVAECMDRDGTPSTYDWGGWELKDWYKEDHLMWSYDFRWNDIHMLPDR